MAGSEFIVKLNGIKLPNELEAKIEREIRSTVMRELAQVDMGSPVGASLEKLRWRGIWIELAGKLKIPTKVSTLVEGL